MAIRKRIAKKAAKKALSPDMIPQPVLDALGKAMVEGVDKAVTLRWQRALDRAAKTQGTRDQRLAELYNSFQKELTSAGAATGAAAATPGLGTAAAASWLTADVAWLALRSTDLIMTIAAIHGHTNATPEQRRAWVLSILAFGDEAATEFTALVDKMNMNPTGVQGMRMPLEVIERVNGSLGTHVLTKYGTRRGIATVGRLLPFGIGAVIGGGANFTMVRNLAKHADEFFRNAPLRETGFSEFGPDAQNPANSGNVITAESRERFSGALPPANPSYEHLPPPPENFDPSQLPPPPAETPKRGFGRWGMS